MLAKNEQHSSLLLLDANSILHRAFHALPPLTTSKGKPTGAIYGFFLVFLRLLKEIEPSHLAVCFDFPAPTFRHTKYKDYKAQRPPTPDDLREQIKEMKKILSDLGVRVLEKEGLEADDIIASLVFAFPKVQKVIVTGDRDLLQLVNPHTSLVLLKRGVKNLDIYDQQKIKEEMGVEPFQIPDLKALVGDPSDNIPGIKNIGPKKALELLKKHRSVEELLSSRDCPDFLQEQKDRVLLWKELVTLKPASLGLSIDDLKFSGLKDYEKVFGDLEFFSLLRRLQEDKRNVSQKSLF